MKVLLLMYQDEKRMRSLPKDEAREVHGAYMAYLGALKEAGVFLANHGLKATTEAKTVRKASCRRMISLKLSVSAARLSSPSKRTAEKRL